MLTREATGAYSGGMTTTQAATDTTSVQYEQGHRFTTLDNAARAYARVYGYTGRPGGWIYDRDGKPIVQGYTALGARLIRAGRITTYDTTRDGWIVLRPF